MQMQRTAVVCVCVCVCVWHIQTHCILCVSRQIAVQLLVEAGSHQPVLGTNGSGSQFKEVLATTTKEGGGGWQLERNANGTQTNWRQLKPRKVREGRAERNGEMECRWNSPEGEEEREDISSPGTPPGSLMSCPQRFQMSNSSQAHCQRVVVTNLLYVSHHCFLFCCVFSILCSCVFAPRLPAHYWWLHR